MKWRLKDNWRDALGLIGALTTIVVSVWKLVKVWPEAAQAFHRLFP